MKQISVHHKCIIQKSIKNMIINKEYPATHSMDTAWFACDLDGNVAIFQFDENGPGPIPFTDLHTDELISMLGKEKDGITMMPFTKEQIEELKSGLKPVYTKDEIRHYCNILIKPSVVDEFIKSGAKFDLCYSVEEGFYHLEYWDSYESDIINKFIKRGDILGAQECDIEIYFEDCRNDTSEHRLAHFPFYVYEQCAINFPPGQVVVPRYPMKVDQMSAEAKEYMFKVPVRFAEKEYIEPAEYIDSQCWVFNNHTKEIKGIKYMQVALTEGGYGYVKVAPHSFNQNISDEWKNAPRVIDKDNKYVDLK